MSDYPNFRFILTSMLYEYRVLVDDEPIGIVRQHRPRGTKSMWWQALNLHGDLIVAECATRRIAAQLIWEWESRP